MDTVAVSFNKSVGSYHTVVTAEEFARQV